MSHVAMVELEIVSLDDLETACKKLGLFFDRQATDWKWYGQWMEDYSAEQAAYRNGIPPERYGKSDAGVIRVPGAEYEIGIYKKGSRFCLVYDNWQDGHGIEKVLGKNLVAIKERYGAVVARKTLQRQGYDVQETRDKNSGRLILRATR